MHTPGEVLKHGEVELKVVEETGCRLCHFKNRSATSGAHHCERPDVIGPCLGFGVSIQFVTLDKYALLRLKGEL